MGTGAAFVYSPLLVATMRAVAPDASAKAASFIVLFFQLGGSISSASIVAFFDRRFQFHQTMLAAQATLSRLPVVQFLQHGSVAQLAAAVTAQAAALAYADAFLVTGVLALFVTPGVLLSSTQSERKEILMQYEPACDRICDDIAALAARAASADVGRYLRRRKRDAKPCRGLPPCRWAPERSDLA